MEPYSSKIRGGCSIVSGRNFMDSGSRKCSPATLGSWIVVELTGTTWSLSLRPPQQLDELSMFGADEQPHPAAPDRLAASSLAQQAVPVSEAGPPQQAVGAGMRPCPIGVTENSELFDISHHIVIRRTTNIYRKKNQSAAISSFNSSNRSTLTQ